MNLTRGQQLSLLRAARIESDGDIRGGILKAVLRCIDDHAGNAGECYTSLATLADESCFSRRTVVRCVNSLREAGYLTGGSQRGKTNSYRINWDRLTSASQSLVTSASQSLVETQLVPASHLTSASQSKTSASQSPKALEALLSDKNTRRKRRSVFVPPTVKEVRAFWTAHRLNGDPEEYQDHYTANGWRQGRQSTPMRDWQAAARNWSRRHKQFGGSNQDDTCDLPPLI